MSEDTKPDKKRKEPWNRSDILAVFALILSVISLFIDVFPRENIQILRAEDDGYYHFDGETLFKNFQVTVANNSAIPVSVVEITIERDGEARTFEIADLPDILPLNMESNHTEMITIPYEIKLTPENAQKLRDILLNDENGKLKSQFSESDILTPSIPMEKNARTKQIYSYYRLYIAPLGDVPLGEVLSSQKIIFSMILSTAKNNQYFLNTEDTGPPESVDEDKWVIDMTIFRRIEYFFEQATLNQLEGVETP